LFSRFQVHPQSEDYWGHVNPIGPRACYDEGKRVAETLAFAYAKQSGKASFSTFWSDTFIYLFQQTYNENLVN
jgi:nucleoside-diphosphate-sugar epimerase